MTETWFFATAVVIGAIVLAAVLWIFIRATVERNTGLLTILTLVGFVLVLTPFWASIAITCIQCFEGPQGEITLLKRTAETQLRTNVELLQALTKSLAPDKAAQIAPEVNRVEQSVVDLKKTDEGKRVKKIQETVNAISKITETIKTKISSD